MQFAQNPARDTLGEAAELAGSSEERLKTKGAGQHIDPGNYWDWGKFVRK